MPLVSADGHTARTEPRRLPVAALLVMALAGFIVTMTETLPAGLLPQLAADLAVSEAAAGQLVGVYAIGITLAVVPAIALTRSLDRRPLLLAALAGFLVANTLTALVPVFAVTLAARVIAGAFAGLLWGMLATYAQGISPPAQAGRALTLAMIGTPVALALGTPAGTWLGTALTWQWAFLAMSVLTIIAGVLAMALVPGLPGRPAGSGVRPTGLVRIAGVATILLTVVAWMGSHNLLYTYIALFLGDSGAGLRVDTALLIFGVSAIAGIWITARLVDRALRPLALVATALMVVAGTALAVAGGSVPLLVAAIVVWGVAFGGSAPQLQTAMAAAAGESADLAIAVFTAAFNLAIFAAALTGGLVIDAASASVLPIGMTVVAGVAFTSVLLGRRAAFPARASVVHGPVR